MKFLLTFALLLSSLSASAPAFANEEAAIPVPGKGKAFELLQRIDDELRFYYQDARTVAAANRQLQAALATLRGAPVNPPPAPVPVPPPGLGECREFAYPLYRQDGFSESTSLDKARTYCNLVNLARADIAVLSYFHEQLRIDGYSNATCLQYAVDIAGDLAESELGCVRTALGRYRKDGLSVRTALQKAVTYCVD